MTFSLADMPDLTDKVALVTGANTGIGFVTARELARHHAHVILAGRSRERTVAAIESIKKETGNENVEFLEMDLASLKAVKCAAEAFLARGLSLSILINNAGIMGVPYGQTVDGYESQLAVNHLAHQLLTTLLTPALVSGATAAAPSRIVFVSSVAHKHTPPQDIDFEGWNNVAAYKPFTAYGQSKLANILCAKQLATALAPKHILVNAVHPGVVRTDLFRYIFSTWPVMGHLIRGVNAVVSRLWMISPEAGALTTLYAATGNEVQEKGYTGEYFIPYGKVAEPTPQAVDAELRAKMWAWSEDLINKALAA